jgi:hypothetical protein
MRGERLEQSKVIAKRKFKRKYRTAYYNSEEQYKRWSDRELRRMRKTGTPCSCTTCGNPRRHFKKITRQELREVNFGRRDN